MKKRTAWILVAGVAAVAIGAAAVGALALVLRGPGGGVSWTGKSYLYLNVHGDIPDQPPSDMPSLFQKRPTTLRVMVEALDHAATDPKVKAVVLRVSPARRRVGQGPGAAATPSSGSAKSGQAGLRAPRVLRQQGVLPGHGVHEDLRAPHRHTRRHRARGGDDLLRGARLDKLGVQAQFEGVGKYKNAPNQLTERASPTRTASRWRRSSTASTRSTWRPSRPAGEDPGGGAQAAVDRGPYDGTEALKAGLVDELIYEDQLRDRLKERRGGHARRRYVEGRGLLVLRPPAQDRGGVRGGRDRSGESQDGGLGGGPVAGSDTVAGALRDARRNDATSRPSSFASTAPAASGTGLRRHLARGAVLARKEKPVVVSMGDVAASGGYYIAMGSDAIVAQPGTITGSIGVFGGKFVLRGLYDKLGVTQGDPDPRRSTRTSSPSTGPGTTTSARSSAR